MPGPRIFIPQKQGGRFIATSVTNVTSSNGSLVIATKPKAKGTSGISAMP
jgi:hypothetical protein